MRNHFRLTFYKLCFSLFASVCVLLELYSGAAQEPSRTIYNPNSKFQAKQLQEDFLILRRALEEAHPGLYRYTNKKAMDKYFIKAIQLLTREMTERDFYGIVASILSAVKDGHTKSLPSNDFEDYMTDKAKVFPLKLRFIGGKAYVISSPNPALARGSRLVSINKRNMADVTRSLFAHLISDGDIETGKYWELNERFGFYYYLFIEQPDSFSIEYYDPVKRLRKIDVPAMTETDARAFNKRSDETYSKPLHLEFLQEQDTALLAIKTFAADDIEAAGQDFPKFLEDAFRKVKQQGTKNLIIDLRGNDGGRDGFGSLLFSYLADKEFRYYDYLETSTDNISFLKYTNASPSFNEMFEGYATPMGPRRFKVKESNHRNLMLQHPQMNYFNGKAWFLVNGQCFSTTAEFCSIAHYQKRGSFIGEEVGGNYYGNTSGTFLILTLPNTKVRILIPLVKYVLAVSGYPYPRRGVMPDYPVQPVIQDVLDGIDVELRFALKLVNNGRQQ